MLFHSFQFSGTVSTDILRPVLLKSFKTLKGKAWTVKPQGKQVQPGKNKNFKSTHKETFISSLPTYLPTLWNYELLEDRFYAWFISVFTLLVLCLAHSLTDGLVCVFFWDDDLTSWHWLAFLLLVLSLHWSFLFSNPWKYRIEQKNIS